MDPEKESAAAKKREEVVILIPVESTATEESSSYPPNDAKSKITPEISKSAGISPKKPPRAPLSGSLIRRRSIAKPKSRFEEPAKFIENSRAWIHEPSSPYSGTSKQKSSGTPRPPLLNAEEEEEEEGDEVYKKELLRGSGNQMKKLSFCLMVEIVMLILATSCLIASLLVKRTQGYVIWGLEIWKWCLMVMVIFCGRLLSYWFITAIIFLIELNFLLRKKVLYFVYGLKKSVQVFIWLGLVLFSWSLVFNDNHVLKSPKTAKALYYVSKALASLLIGALIWLVKTLLVKILASSFHMSRFFDRIQETLYHQYLLQVLSGPPVMEMADKFGPFKSSAQLSFLKSKGKGKGEEIEVIDIAKLHRISRKKVSALTMRGLANVIRTSGLSTISDKIDQSFEKDMGEHKDKEITNEGEARSAAHQIFKNVAKPGYKYIEVEDLMRFLSKEEVSFVLPLFDGAPETGKIKKSALRNWAVKAYLERKFLAHSLNDTKTAVNQLHKLFTAIVIVLTIIITLIMMGFATTKVLLFISSQVVLIGFIFTNSCKAAFEAIIFVFVIHPFDVGDRCVIDGVQMIVEEMNILTTVFLQHDNAKIYYPNSILATKPIRNFYRSPDMGDSVEFSVDISTSVEKIADLKARTKMYIENKPNHWRQNHCIVVKDIVDMINMNMVLYVTHTMNFQNIVEKNIRRTDLILGLKKIFEELSIRCNLLPQEVRLSNTGPNPPPMTIDQDELSS